MDKAEKEMLQEIALRNAVAKFKKLNLARTKTASTPEVGIFWIDDTGTMFAESVSLLAAEDYGEFKMFDKSHVDVWNAAVIRAVPKWSHLEYEQVPRGRVVYKSMNATANM